MRELLPLIAYTEENPELSDLAARLNRGRSKGRGFTAECHRSEMSSDGLKLRDFFGGPVSPSEVVEFGKEKCEMRFVIPSMLPEDFFDDNERCGGNVYEEEDEFIFVEVRRGGDEELEVIRCGKLESDYPSQRVIIEHILNEKAKKPPPPHVWIWDLISATMAEVKNRQVIASGSNGGASFCEVRDVLKEINGVIEDEELLLDDLIECWHLFSVEEWRERISRVHDALVDESSADDLIAKKFNPLSRLHKYIWSNRRDRS
jgi:hypothetical protein